MLTHDSWINIEGCCYPSSTIVDKQWQFGGSGSRVTLPGDRANQGGRLHVLASCKGGGNLIGNNPEHALSFKQVVFLFGDLGFGWTTGRGLLPGSEGQGEIPASTRKVPRMAASPKPSAQPL